MIQLLQLKVTNLVLKFHQQYLEIKDLKVKIGDKVSEGSVLAYN